MARSIFILNNVKEPMRRRWQKISYIGSEKERIGNIFGEVWRIGIHQAHGSPSGWKEGGASTGSVNGSRGGGAGAASRN